MELDVTSKWLCVRPLVIDRIFGPFVNCHLENIVIFCLFVRFWLDFEQMVLYCFYGYFGWWHCNLCFQGMLNLISGKYFSILTLLLRNEGWWYWYISRVQFPSTDTINHPHFVLFSAVSKLTIWFVIMFGSNLVQVVKWWQRIISFPDHSEGHLVVQEADVGVGGVQEHDARDPDTRFKPSSNKILHHILFL